MTVRGLHREASIEIHASTEAVDDLVSDLPRMGAWSPGNIGGEWQGGGKVGDRSIGPTLDARARYTEDMLATTLATIKATAEG